MNRQSFTKAPHLRVHHYEIQDKLPAAITDCVLLKPKGGKEKKRRHLCSQEVNQCTKLMQIMSRPQLFPPLPVVYRFPPVPQSVLQADLSQTNDQNSSVFD